MARRTEGRMAPLLLSLALAAAGCSNVQPVQDSGRAAAYDISCGYFGWYICYDRANQVCPGGYKVVSEKEEHFGGRSMRVSCEAQK